MQISDKVGIIGLVFVALGGGYSLVRSIVSHRHRVAEERCAKCHSDSKRDNDNLKNEITGLEHELQTSYTGVERKLSEHIANNRDDHKRIHERIDELFKMINGSE